MRSNPVKQIFSLPANNKQCSRLWPATKCWVLTDKTSITFKSKLQFPDEANSLAGFLWPFCRFSILLLWPPGGWSSLPSLPLSSFLWVFVSDDFQSVTGHEASLLSTRHSDEAAAFALAAHANLREKKSYLWQHLRIENTVCKCSRTKYNNISPNISIYNM